MEYLNLHTSTLDSEEFIGCEPVDQATWLKLQRYCVGQENGGRIAGCREWKDRKCQQLLRVTRVEMLRECDLWTWDQNDLVLFGYPLEQEAAVKAKRAGGRIGGAAKTEAKTQASRTNGNRGGRPKTQAGTQGETEASPQAETQPEPKENPTERKGREGKEMEKERESVREDVIDLLSSQAEQIVNAFPRRERIAEALVIVRKQLASGEDFAVMLAGTKAAADMLATAPSGAANKYAPSALKFFEGKRWLDDPATLIRPAANGAGEMSAEELALQLGGRSGEFKY